MRREYVKPVDDGQEIVDKGEDVDTTMITCFNWNLSYFSNKEQSKSTVGLELYMVSGGGFDYIMANSPKEHQKVLAEQVTSCSFSYHPNEKNVRFYCR